MHRTVSVFSMSASLKYGMKNESIAWQNDRWTKKHNVDPERTALAVQAIPAPSAAKKLNALEKAMQGVEARIKNLPAGAAVHVDEASLPDSRTLRRWELSQVPPSPQSACLIVALLELTGINISLGGIGQINPTDLGRRTSISVSISGPLNIQGDDGEALISLHSLDFRSYEIKEEIRNPEEQIPQRVILSFDELTFHINSMNSNIDRTRDVLGETDFEQESDARSNLRIAFSGFPEKAWVVDAADGRSAINGSVTSKGTALCTLAGTLTPDCSLRVLCRPENLLVETRVDSGSAAALSPQEHFRNKLVGNLIRDDLYSHAGYYLLKEQPILENEDGD